MNFESEFIKSIKSWPKMRKWISVQQLNGVSNANFLDKTLARYYKTYSDQARVLMYTEK